MVSSRTKSTFAQIENLEANLEGLLARMPDAPIANVLLSRLILHLGRGMSRLLHGEIRPCGLTEAEFRVLTALFSQPDGIAHPGELCARTSQSPANMSRISDALVARGLITRLASVRDRRKMVLSITEPGENLVRRLLPALYAPLRDMFQDFSETEMQQLTAQLKRLVEGMTEAMPAHAEERDA